MSDTPAFEIAGVRINAVTIADAVAIIDRWIRDRRRDYVVLTGAHGVVEMQDDAELREINNHAGLTAPDGMSVVWFGKLRGFARIEKLNAPTLMDAMFAAGVGSGYRHYLYGGAEGVAEELRAALERRFPGISVTGTHCPPFRVLSGSETGEIAERINRSDPDIVWVGLGCPKQERWMAQFRPLVSAPVLIGVGAGFDFLSARIPLAPRWLQTSGFEWLFRLASEPKRLLPRYSRVVPKFLFYAGRDWLSRRSRSADEDKR